MIMLMPDIQKSRSSKPLPHRTTEDVRPTELGAAKPARRLDGEVTKTGDVALYSGPHCEIWAGRWVKGGDVEKVRLRLVMSTPLT